jgi:hypothetical protein
MRVRIWKNWQILKKEILKIEFSSSSNSLNIFFENLLIKVNVEVGESNGQTETTTVRSNGHTYQTNHCNGHANHTNGSSGHTESTGNGTNGGGNLDDSEENIESADDYIRSCPYKMDEIRINKINGAMGLSIVGGGNVPCHPFGIDKPGVFISKIVKEGAASRTPLRVGDRILKVNGVDVTRMSHDDCVDELKRNASHVSLLVSHDPQPDGMAEIVLARSFADETIGIRINGGIENKSANIYDPADEGIFVVNVINGTLAHRDGRLKVGTRIMEVS